MIELKITADTTEELHAILAGMGYTRTEASTVAAAAPAPKTEPLTTAAIRGTRAARGATAAAATAAGLVDESALQACASENVPETTQAPVKPDLKVVEKAEPLDYQNDVAARVLKLVRDQGKDAATTFLSRFGVASARELTEDRWPEVVGELKIALGE